MPFEVPAGSHESGHTGQSDKVKLSLRDEQMTYRTAVVLLTSRKHTFMKLSYICAISCHLPAYIRAVSIACSKFESPDLMEPPCMFTKMCTRPLYLPAQSDSHKVPVERNHPSPAPV
jgi:hypothetical protein